MKFMKLALLGTAALAAVSVTARADDLADLKAQIEALKADVANLQAAPAVPAGYSLMTVGDAAAIVVPTIESNKFEYGATASNIGVLPTADMPASTNIQWSGFVRAALVYSDFDASATTGSAPTTLTTALDDTDADELHIKGRAELKVVGTTDTAVGEVGALVKLRGEFDGYAAAGVTMPEAWGWWKMTPELTLGAGYTGSLATINHAADNMTAMYGGGLTQGTYGFGDNSQFRLSYASGPISAAVSLNHYGEEMHFLTTTTGVADNDDDMGAEAEIKYSGDTFSVELAGGVADDNWKAGIGATANLSDMFSLQLSAQMGENNDYVWQKGAMPLVTSNGGSGASTVATDGSADYWVVSALVVAALSDSISAELGASYAEADGHDNINSAGAGAFNYDGEYMGVAAGLYYTPVSQLTIGLEGSYNTMEESESTTPTSVEVDTVKAAFVTVFRF